MSGTTRRMLRDLAVEAVYVLAFWALLRCGR